MTVFVLLFGRFLRTTMFLRFVLVFASLSLFFANEANGQLFGRFSGRFNQRPAQQFQPYRYAQPERYGQTYGYQGQLNAKPRYRSNANYYAYDASGRLVRMTNSPYSNPNGPTRPSCTCQQNRQQSEQRTAQSTRPTQQTDLAKQFRGAGQQQRNATRSTPRPVNNNPDRLVLKQPKSEQVADSSVLNEPATEIQIGQASTIPFSDKITNPVPAGLSLSPETLPGQIMPASGIAPDPSQPEAEQQEPFSVLQKID
jgi:hypothetical protein